PEARKRYILADCGARAVIAMSDDPLPNALGITVIRAGDPTLAGEPDDDLGATGNSTDLAYLIYTSGSTGKPKGVMIEHRSVFNRLHWMQRAYPIADSDVILQKTPYYFDVSVWELFWWAMEGATLCFLAPGGERNPLAILE